MNKKKENKLDKAKVYDRYKYLGMVTLFPLSIIVYFSLYVFRRFFRTLTQSNFPKDYNLETTMGAEKLADLLFFPLLFLALFLAVFSSISYSIAGYKQDEKWLRRAQNLRIFPWIVVILCGLGFVGMMTSLILNRI